MQTIGYKCKNPSTGDSNWLSNWEDVDETQTNNADPYYFCGVKLQVGNDTAGHRIKGIAFKSCPFVAVSSIDMEYDLESASETFSSENIYGKTFSNAINEEGAANILKTIDYTFFELWSIDSTTFDNDYIGELTSVDYTDSEYITYLDYYENWTFNSN